MKKILLILSILSLFSCSSILPKHVRKETVNIVNGVKQGKAVYYSKDGYREEFTYVDGVVQGESTLYLKDGRIIKRIYKDGELISGK
ncbi:hypothetical protein [Oceanivirga salmonicida]|uniref:hypothetical protein n=1 Tax=Oceanivirga salmonicida TaxID=1769291 RepID=UPI00082CD31E|nr:hypothetical protein [Oceanivirga salmonicida]